MKYLLDTNIIIFFFKKKYGLRQKIKSLGDKDLVISEITLAELKFGAEKSENPEKHFAEIADFLKVVSVLPITSAIDLFAKEKARLQNEGIPIEDFDLLIGSTAFANKMVMVTNNTKHFNRLQKIKIEDWTQPS